MARSVVILGFPGVQALDLIGPHDVFTGAALLTEGGYRVTVASRDGTPVTTSTSLAFVAEAMPDPQDMDEQTALSHVKAIPTEVVRDCLLCGTPDEIVDRAAQWRDAGVEYAVLANLGPLQRSLRKGLTSMLPLMQVVRRLKKL